jgi:hypothetical protein
MELLIIKAGKDYIRFKNENYYVVKLDKASVFPFDKLDIAKSHASSLKNRGFKDVLIKKLTLIEGDL